MKALENIGGAALIALGLYLHSQEAVITPGEPQLAWVQVGMFALSVGMSWLAGRLLEKENKALAQDDKPTSTATRGAFLPRVIGRRRVGTVIGWVGDRFKRKEAAGKKGNPLKPEVEIWRESAWHMLAVGPGSCLNAINQNGCDIFVGPITPDSHPSGSVIDLGSEGSFAIYWGEIDQPQNDFLGDAARVPEMGVTSRWPNTMYIQWIAKRLSEQPVWPLLVYDITVNPAETHLSDTTAVMPATLTLDGATVAVDSVTTGVQGTGKFRVLGNVASLFSNKGTVESALDSTFPDGSFSLLKMETSIVGFNVFTDFFPIGGIVAATGDGTLQAYSEAPDDGINPAHILADLWFSKWPHGIAQPTSKFDLQSLEDFGTLCVTEGLKFSMIAKDGQNLRSVMASLHQDAGVVLPIDFTTGLLKFQPVRAPTGPIPNIPGGAIIELPQKDKNHGPKKSDRLVFTFADRENNFREMPIGINDSGQATFMEFFRSRSVRLPSIINFGSANVAAERRSQEELGGGYDLKLVTNRGTRILLPGTQVTADDIDEVMLIMAVEADVLSDKVTLSCIPDFLGAKKSDFVQIQAPIASPVVAVQPDPQFQPIEWPEWLSGQSQQITLARLRAHAQVTGGITHISGDDVTFIDKGEDTSIMQGGVLTEALDITDTYYIAQGPQFTALGPDIASVLDLTSDNTGWRGGRQLCLIGSELFFLEAITAIGGDVYRLDGLIRARYDTRVEAHSIGAEVYIIQDDDGLPVVDPLIAPSTTLYTKSQAVGRGVDNIAVVPSESIALYGKGIRPVPVSDIRFDTLSDPAGVSTHSWVGTGSTDLDITWGYFTPQAAGSGAGFSGAGTPQGAATPEGDFIIEILDSIDVLVNSYTSTTNTFTYTEVDRLADFTAAEPTVFKARVTQLRAGLSSDTVTQTFTRI
jgi:hypothetical protein